MLREMLSYIPYKFNPLFFNKTPDKDNQGRPDPYAKLLVEFLPRLLWQDLKKRGVYP